MTNDSSCQTVKRPEFGVVALTPILFDPTTCEHLETCRTHPEYDDYVPICDGCIKDDSSHTTKNGDDKE